MRQYFSNLDLEKLAEAEQKLQEVYDYNYGDSKSQSELAKLQTIIRKLQSLRKIMQERTV